MVYLTALIKVETVKLPVLQFIFCTILIHFVSIFYKLIAAGEQVAVPVINELFYM